MIKASESKLAMPSKPYPEFPLFAHATRRWAKKIRGKLHYFGPWDDPDGALGRYLDQRDDLHAGRKPRSEADSATTRDLCNRFLTSKQHLVDTGELSTRTFDDYFRVCQRVLRVFGKRRLITDFTPTDFEQLRADIAKTLKVVALGNEINRCRVLFKYAYDADLIDRPIKYGPTFKRPSRRILRMERQKSGPRMFEAEDLTALIDEANVQMRAMILLGINCGFGNADIERLPTRAVSAGSQI